MWNRPRIAVFGVTPLSLLLGRACCLADNPPVGVYDENESSALEGALCLGVSARREPNDLNPDSLPLQVAIFGTESATQALDSLYPIDNLLIITLFDWTGSQPASACSAIPIHTGDPSVYTNTISAGVPEMTFDLKGSDAKKQAAQEFLNGLSCNIRFKN